MLASPGSSTFLNSTRVSGIARRLSQGERLVGEGLLAGAKLPRNRLGVGVLERAVVALVDRRHRGDVAGAQALEARYEQLAVLRGRPPVRGLLGIAARRLAEGIEQPVGAVHPARDVGADQHPVAPQRLEAKEVVEARNRLE